ncbi:MAG: autotransporter-associated beta strand repeat-containing protein [Opitutae bacterium]|nr:autotransporter-associated beta strand repeat-containing protein [Opitutae bacterium]
MKPRLVSAALLFFVASVNAPAGALVFTWQGTGGTNNNWTTANNWQGGVAPPTDGSATVLLPNFTNSFINVDSNQSVNQLIFQSDQFYSIFGSNTSGVVTLTIGAGGISYSSASGGPFTNAEILSPRPTPESPSALQVVTGADQIWAINQGRLSVSTDIGGSGRITKTGDGELQLSGLNGSLAGVTLQQGLLSISGNSALGSGTFILGPALTTGVSPAIRARSNNSSGSGGATGVGGATITNATTINGVLNVFESDDLKFTGPVTLASPTTAVNIQDSGVEISGAIGESGGSSSIVMNSAGSLILSGNNTYTGGTVVQNGVLVFATAGAIPATGSLRAESTLGGTNLSHGYIGFGDSAAGSLANPQTVFLDRFDKANTTGTVGFDTDPKATAPNNYSGPISLAGFGTNARLGSATTTNNGTTAGAILSGTITPQGTSFNFGGGGGFLQVDSALTGANSVVLNSPGRTPLTLRLTNAGNNYSAGTSVTNSAVIFGVGALPAGTSNVSINTGGYVGTESANANTGVPATDDVANAADVASFLGRINVASTGMIGFDAPAGASRTLGSDLNLGAFAGNLFLGTATSTAAGGAGLSLTGAITTTNGGVDSYRFAGYKGGNVSVHSTLTGTRGVIIGDPTVQATFGDFNAQRISTVGLFNNANNYSGGTTFGAGRLLVGGGPNAITGVLGTGALAVAPTALFAGQQHDDGPVVLEAADNNLTIANAIVLNRDLQVSGLNALTLSGSITGLGALRFELLQDVATASTANYTLSGANTFSGGIDLALSQNLTTNLNIATDTGAGTGAITANGPGNSGAANLNFASNAPVIGGLNSFSTSVTLNLATESTLTINQTTSGSFQGTINGAAAKVVKTGTGSLQLSGTGNYASTDVLGGALILQNNFAVGSGPITLNGVGAQLLAASNSPLTNPLILTQGTLGGNGTFAPTAVNNTTGAGITIGSGLALSPGVDEFGGVGFTTFAVSLTLASGGGYRWDIRDTSPGGPGLAPGFDSVQASAGLDITATRLSPFLITLGSPDNAPTIANFSSSSPFSLSLLNSSTAITGFTGSDQFLVDASFFNSITNGGAFTVTLGGAGGNTSLLLNFAPVPEPSTYALLALGLGVVAVPFLRRRR